MTGDFTRDSFEAIKRFRRVLLQQGRVQLDADVNEQTAILLHHATLLTTSVVGRFGGPKQAIDVKGRWVDNTGFKIEILSPGTADNFAIDVGHYYVDGILCESFDPQLFLAQPDYPTPDKPNVAQPFLVYLEVFERALAAAQDDAIAEPALEGLDTAARSRLVCQVKTIAKLPDDLPIPTTAPSATDWNAWLEILDPPGRGLLRARANSDVATDTGPCVVPISSAFRGEDNQLYRVEIHDGSKSGKPPTFKWSRENGSVLFPIESLTDATVTVTSLGRDRRFGLQPGDWVEVTDDGRDLRRNDGNILPLFQVDSIKRDQRLVVLKKQQGVDLPQYEEGDSGHPLLRRWDGPVAPITEVQDPSSEFTLLENGVQVQFLTQDTASQYRSGDYWLIPARVALGDIIWPFGPDGKTRQKLPPRGIARHFAPLASWRVGKAQGFIDLRKLFDGLGGP